MDEKIKVSDGMTVEETVETMARLTYEIVEQFTESARNANKIYDTFGDMMRQSPFGIVLGIYVGPHKMVTQVLGKSTQCKAALMEIAAQIENVEKEDEDER